MEKMTPKKKYRKNTYPVLLLAVILMFSIDARSQELPDIPDLIRVTVDHADDGVLIQWSPSTDSDIMFYHLYKMNPFDSFEKIFSFSPNTLEYKHMTSGLKNLAYAVTAEDSTGNESLFGQNVHRAVAVSTEFDLCTQSNIIGWTPYEGWEGNISGYRIYGGLSSGPLQFLSFVHPSTNSYTQTDVEVETLYSYYVETVNTNGMLSLSSIDTVATLFPDAPSHLSIDQVSVVDEANVELRFSADLAGPVSSFRILRRSTPITPYLEVETLWNINEPIQLRNDQFPTGSISYQYLVQSVFQPAGCSESLVISESNTANSILLVNEINDHMVTLNWTPYELYEPGLTGYVIQRRNGSGEFSDLATVGPLTTQWQEDIQSLINGFQSGEVLYRVVALANPNDEGFAGASYSNITAAAVETHMQVPSAFTPGSHDMNFEFKPIMDFAPETYLFVVVDRGGRKMFETTDPGEGWDGRFQNGEFVHEAVYVYYIQYTDFTGLFKTFTGNVTVLYP